MIFIFDFLSFAVKRGSAGQGRGNSHVSALYYCAYVFLLVRAPDDGQPPLAVSDGVHIFIASGG